MYDTITIRDAQAGDVQEMALLVTQLGYPTSADEMQTRFEQIAAHPDYKTIAAFAGEEMVGLAGLVKGIYYEYNGSYMRILSFVVKQGNRQLGVGRLLIKACEDWALSQDLHTVVLSSGNRAEREAAHAFYQKVGYTLKSSGFVKQL